MNMVHVAADGLEQKVIAYLYPPSGHEGGAEVKNITLLALLAAVGVPVERLTPGRFHEKVAASVLRRFGWIERRSEEAGRPRVFHRPDVESCRVVWIDGPVVMVRNPSLSGSESDLKDGCLCTQPHFSESDHTC